MTPAPAGPLLDEAVVARALGHALATGGEFAEIFVEDRRSLAGGARRRPGRGAQLWPGAGGWDPCGGGKTTGFAHTADLSERGLLAAAEAASGAARSGGGPGRAGLPLAHGGHEPVAGRGTACWRGQVSQGRAAPACRRGCARRRGGGAPGERPLPGQPTAGPGGQLGRRVRHRRPGPGAVRGPGRSPTGTPACRPAARRSGRRWVSSCSTTTTSRKWPARLPGVHCSSCGPVQRLGRHARSHKGWQRGSALP